MAHEISMSNGNPPATVDQTTPEFWRWGAAAFAQDSNGFLNFFCVDVNHELWTIRQLAPGGVWGAWRNLGAPSNGLMPESRIVVEPNQDGRLQVFATGSDSKLYTVWQQNLGGNWSHWGPFSLFQTTGGILHSLAVAQNADGRLEVFTIDSRDDGTYWLAHSWQTAPNNGWSEWASMFSVALASELSVVRDTSGCLQLVVVNGPNGVTQWAKQMQPNGGWMGWSNMGGSVTGLSSPSLVLNEDGHLEVFARTSDQNKIYHLWQVNASWVDDWRLLAESPTNFGSVTVGRNRDGRLEVFTASDDKLFHIWQTVPNGSWSDGAFLDEPPVGHLGRKAVVCSQGGSLELAAMMGDHTCWLIAQDHSSPEGWGQWRTDWWSGDGSIVNWLATTGQMPADDCLAFGRLWVALGSSVVSYDVISGAVDQRISGFGSSNLHPQFIQPYGDLLAVACDDQWLYTIDPDSGEIAALAYVGDLTWMASYEGSVFVSGSRGLYRVARPDEHVHTPHGPLVGPYGQGSLGGDPTVADGVVYVPLNNVETVAALDAMTLNPLWEAGVSGWSAWAVLGEFGLPAGVVMGDLVTGNEKDGPLYVFGIKNGGAVYAIHTTPSRAGWEETSTGWSEWTTLPTIPSGSPRSLATGNDQDGELEVFGLDGSGVAWHSWRDSQASSGWSDWEVLGATGHPPGVTFDNLATGNAKDGPLYVFAIGSDGAVHTIHREPSRPTGWSEWTALPAVPSGASFWLAVGNDPGGALEVFCRDGHGAVRHSWQDPQAASGWSDWRVLGATGHPPDVHLTNLLTGSQKDGPLYVFGTDGDRVYAIHGEPSSSTGWSEWAALAPIRGGVFSGSLRTGRDLNGVLTVLAQFSDGMVYTCYHQPWSSTGWSEWTALPALTPGMPALRATGNGPGGELEVFSLTTHGDSHPYYSRQAAAPGAIGAAYCDGSTLAFASRNRTVFFYDVGSRTLINQLSLSSDVVGAPIIDGDRAHVAATSGRIEVIDYRAGKSVGSHQLTVPPIGTGILNENGVLFYRAHSQIFAVDPAAGGPSGVVTHDTKPSPVMAGYAQGALFYADSENASAVRLDEQIHNYYAETNLIRDFDFQGSIDDPASTPNFQVQIGLFMKDGSPRANETVRITATAPTDILYQGQRVRVSQDQYLDVTTDGVGRFRVGVPAGAVDDAGTFKEGLSAPELLLAASFMDPATRFVVRPNGEMADHLATIDKDQLAGAKGYDNTHVVTDEYRNDPKTLGDAASAINETAGMVRGSMSEPRKRAAGNRYCDPACDMAVASCMPAANPGCRVVLRHCYSFSIEIGASHFRRLSADEARAAALSLTGGEPGSWLGDLWDDIKTGAAKVVGAVVEAGTDIVKATVKIIKDGIQKLEVVIDTLEKAVLLVQGIFNTIATAIKRVVEALSFLFDWKAILDVHDQIRDQVNSAWDSLAKDTDGVSFNTIKNALDGALDTAKEKADQAFNDAKKALGARSALTAQSDATGQPNSVVGTGQNDWLLAKFKDHALPDGGPRARTAVAATAVSWPDFEPGEEVAKAFDNFKTKLGDSVGADVKATLDRIREDLDFQSSPGILARGIAAVIDIIRGLTDVAIDIVKAVGDLAIELLKTALKALRSFVNAKIEIPYVTDLYRWATGNDLTLLDLMALLVAIPTGFALKLVSRKPAYASGVSPDRPTALRATAAPTLPLKGWLEVAAGCAQMLWAVLNGVLSAIALNPAYEPLPDSDLSKFMKVRIGITIGALIVVRGLFGAALVLASRGGKSVYAAFVFAWPTVAIMSDICFMWYAHKDPDAYWGSMIVSVFLGFATVLFGLIDAFEDKTLDNWLEFTYAIFVGLFLAMRMEIVWAQVIKDGDKSKGYPLQLGGVLAAGIFALVSGAVEVARGAVVKDATTDDFEGKSGGVVSA